MSQNFDAFGTPISQPEQRVSMIDITPEEAAQGKTAPYVYSQEQTLPINVNAPVEFDYEEKVPVNYDEFGNVITEPQMSVASSARIVEPPVFSDTLVNFVKNQEGFRAEKYVDGDKNAIGYGHNLTPEEAKTNTVYGHDVSKPITEEIAQDILLKDLASKRKSLNSAIKKKYKDISLEELPLKSQEMLIDFQFNLGDAIGKFPKFTDAVIKGDIKTAKKEYKRYFGKKKIPLTKRNTDFYNTYLR
jgi:GH24 family phage-related lysozyme (muramidase)